MVVSGSARQFAVRGKDRPHFGRCWEGKQTAVPALGVPESALRVRVGVVGCGYWGPQLIRNFNELRTAELVAVAERRPDRLDYVQEHYRQVAALSDYQDLLRQDLEAVVIATPIQTHYQLTRAALLAGKHVMVEKPLATSVQDALELQRMAAERNLVVMVGHTFLYNPAVRELRRLVASGELGQIYYLDAARLNLGLFQREVDVIWDLAPHDISILLYVLQRRIKRVSARGSACVQAGVHDVAYLELLFECDVRAQIHVSWLDPCKVRRLTIVGDRKMAVYNDVSFTEKIRIYNTGVEPPNNDTFGEFQLSYRYGEMTAPYIPWQEPLRLQCEHFVSCVQTGAKPESDVDHGIEVVAVLEAAARSLAKAGTRVSLNGRPSLNGSHPGPNGSGSRRKPTRIILPTA